MEKNNKIPLCPDGYKWCPIKEKCIPAGQGKGVKEMDTIKEALNLVDVILSGDYDDYKKIQEADSIMDSVLSEVENKIDTDTEQDIEKLQQDVVDELTQDEKNSLEEMVSTSISKLIREEEYREFFKKMLKKYNISNPSELDDSKKKEFFNAVDKEWKANKETD